MRSSLLLPLLIISLAGCTTDTGQTLLILRDQIPGDGCTVNAGATGNFISVGKIDTEAEGGYIFTPVVRNIARIPAGREQGNNIAFISGAEVDIEFADGEFFNAGERDSLDTKNLLSYSTAFGGTIQPLGTSGFAIDVLPYELLQEMAGKLAPGEQTNVVSKVKVFGELDGGEIESQTWAHNIMVCNGCMTDNVGLCTDLPAGYKGSAGGQCNELQDFVLECCTTDQGGDRCPAAAGI